MSKHHQGATRDCCRRRMLRTPRLSGTSSCFAGALHASRRFKLPAPCVWPIGQGDPRPCTLPGGRGLSDGTRGVSGERGLGERRINNALRGSKYFRASFGISRPGGEGQPSYQHMDLRRSALRQVCVGKSVTPRRQAVRALYHARAILRCFCLVCSFSAPRCRTCVAIRQGESAVYYYLPNAGFPQERQTI